jgi:prolipoprotein diacylglyceryltransferase
MQIGPWWIHPYTLQVMLGALGGCIWLWVAAPHYGASRSKLTGLLWAISGGALLVGRLGYVTDNLAYFVQHPENIVRIWHVGGIQASWAWGGGLFMTWLWARLTRFRITAIFGLLAPAALLTSAGAWWGCADLGCAWGHEALRASVWTRWAVIEAPDLYHSEVPRYAVQHIALVWSLAMALTAILLKQLGGLAIVLYLLGDTMLFKLRADPAPLVGGYRVAILLDLGLALWVWILVWRNSHSLK